MRRPSAIPTSTCATCCSERRTTRTRPRARAPRRAGSTGPRQRPSRTRPSPPRCRSPGRSGRRRRRVPMSDGSLDRLLVVQDLDTSITQLTHRRAALAERVGLVALDIELGALAAEEATLTAQRRELMATQKDLEAQIAVADERRTGIEQRMYAARGSSTRDLQAMDEEVRHLTQRRAELEEEELVAMVEQEPIDAELKDLSERRDPLEEQAPALRVEVGSGQTEIDAELAVAIPARAEAAAQLPADLS